MLSIMQNQKELGTVQLGQNIILTSWDFYQFLSNLHVHGNLAKSKNSSISLLIVMLRELALSNFFLKELLKKKI